jgi:DnaK suppressor protein
MTNTELTLHRENLLALRARLQGDTSQMEDHALNQDHSRSTSMPTNQAELGTENFDQELTLSLVGSENNAISQIDEALKRIEDGSYGLCDKCGARIPKARLDAVPYAAQCVQCASQQEENER